MPILVSLKPLNAPSHLMPPLAVSSQVLSNLAMLYLQQRDGKNALRCCDEVLALQGTPHGPDASFMHKAILR
jgi:hypothetical protein